MYKMSNLKVKEKDIVVPGEVLANGMDFLPSQGTFRDGDDIVANMIGLTFIDGRVLKVIPLNAKYIPRPGDMVIGKVTEMSFSSWFLDIGCANRAMLSVRETQEFIESGVDLSRYYRFGDYIVAKIIKVTRGNIDLTMKEQGLRRLGVGKLININTSKVPRIIGKQGSMISMIKEKTNCRIVVGKNGLVWLQGEPADERVAAEAITMINEDAHKDGLTERIEEFINKKCKGGKDEKK
tara:strand:- start:33788 stop:34498 length:711 start_codon:yes stop_codon:yes gene_type:complete